MNEMITGDGPMPMMPGPEAPVDQLPGTAPEAQPVNPVPVHTEDPGDRMFEDFFPKLALTEAEEKLLGEWFVRDLKSCVKGMEAQRKKWAIYRAVYMMEYIQRCYPSMGMGMEYPSGLLCEKMLEGMGHLDRAIFSPRPLFVVDDKTSNIEDIDFVHRAEWFLHTLFMRDLKVKTTMGKEALFDFLLDGSCIMEADQMYERVPMRVLKTYTPAMKDELLADAGKALDDEQYREAQMRLEQGQSARLLIEKEVLTKNGLQLILVNKVDHLIPPGVFRDSDVRFRARRLYLTGSDLAVLGDKDVNWYDKAKVDKVLAHRRDVRSTYRAAQKGSEDHRAREEVSQRDEARDLFYDWRSESDVLTVEPGSQPYKETFAVFRITAKYGYSTKTDPKGLLPKFCVFDFEPESRTILRARTYPHFHEQKNYFHFKLGIAPKSYYGFGFGARLVNEDQLESNSVMLYLDGAALSTIRPFVCVSPEFDGRVPFLDGIGPGKVGYVRNVNEFAPFEIPPPPEGILRYVLPLTAKRSECRTSVSSLVQGRTEATDPRAPAQKAQMLLRQAYIGIEDMISDWNESGWEALANFVWKAKFESAVYEGQEKIEDVIQFPGMMPESERSNVITVDELSKDIQWVSQAGSEFINSEIRETEFLRRMQFFGPLLQQLAQVNPELYKKYFMRWMYQAAQEFNLRRIKYLIPTEGEMAALPPAVPQGAMEGILEQLKGGQSAQNAPIPENGQPQ
jgi:hypothetical protein